MFLFEHLLHLGRRLDSKAAFLLWLIHCLCSSDCLFFVFVVVFCSGGLCLVFVLLCITKYYF